jgi:hypothetical protein
MEKYVRGALTSRSGTLLGRIRRPIISLAQALREDGFNRQTRMTGTARDQPTQSTYLFGAVCPQPRSGCILRIPINISVGHGTKQRHLVSGT